MPVNQPNISRTPPKITFPPFRRVNFAKTANQMAKYSGKFHSLVGQITATNFSAFREQDAERMKATPPSQYFW